MSVIMGKEGKFFVMNVYLLIIKEKVAGNC